MELLLKMRCDQLECGVRAPDELETMQDAYEAGWITVRDEYGEFVYCSRECLTASVA